MVLGCESDSSAQVWPILLFFFPCLHSFVIDCQLIGLLFFSFFSPSSVPFDTLDNWSNLSGAIPGSSPTSVLSAASGEYYLFVEVGVIAAGGGLSAVHSVVQGCQKCLLGSGQRL